MRDLKIALAIQSISLLLDDESLNKVKEYLDDIQDGVSELLEFKESIEKAVEKIN